MNKIMRIGMIPCGKNKASVFIKATVKEEELSITGVIGPLQSGNARGGCGQIDMEFSHRNPEDNDSRYDNPIPPEAITFAPGWNKEFWLDLLEIWKRWHLNNMNAGCKHQRALGWKSYENHPSEPCPVCGYKYGTAWKKEKLPQSVIAKLRSMPDTDKTPAWI